MRIRKTIEEDFDRVMEIYAYAREFMTRTGNPNQWGPTNWPPEELIRKDIEPTYHTIEDGAWIDGGSYGVVHRLASDGSEICIREDWEERYFMGKKIVVVNAGLQ